MKILLECVGAFVVSIAIGLPLGTELVTRGWPFWSILLFQFSIGCSVGYLFLKSL